MQWDTCHFLHCHKFSYFYEVIDDVRNHVIACLGLNVSCSVHNCGFMVDVGNAMAAMYGSGNRDALHVNMVFECN